MLAMIPWHLLLHALHGVGHAHQGKPVVKSRSYKKTRSSMARQTAPETKELILANCLNEDELIERLGAPTLSFRAARANMFAGVIAGLILVGIGALIEIGLVFGLGSPMVVFISGALVALLGFIYGGTALLVWIKRNMSFRVLVCRGGIVQIYRGQAVGCGWDQISEATVSERFQPGNIGNRVCTLIREDGLKFVFTTNKVDHIPRLIEVIASRVPLT